jgi:N-acetylglutamate synthase-like GNAT family acetyltransferase
VKISMGKYIYLADRPELIPELAGWFYNEWGRHNLDLSLKSIEEKLKGRLNREQVPLVLVHIQDGSAIATASIKIQEMETHPHYQHWLGSVYVMPEYRDQGIGTELIRYTVGEAKRLAVDELYLYTRNKEKFYTKLGWQSLETPIYHGRRVFIMKQELSLNGRTNL